MNDAAANVLPSSQEAAALNGDRRSASTARRADVATALLDQSQERSRLQKEKCGVFLDSLIRDLDIVLFCELSILYYMDCSLFHFLIRALPHWFYLTPKHSIFPPPPLARHVYIGAILGSNLFCFFIHLIFSAPTAGEASRGYLHGGIVIDFVGQISPVSKLRLLAVDLLVLILQLLVMALTLEKQVLQGRATAREVLSAGLEQWGSLLRRQDHDLEERGLLASNAPSVTAMDVELQHLGPSGQRSDAEDDLSSSRAAYQDDSMVDGEHVIARLHLLGAVRAQWHSYVGASAFGTVTTSNRSSQVADTFLAASRRFSSNFRGRSDSDNV